MDKMDIIPNELDGKNYISWSFHIKNFVEGKGLLGYLDGTNPQPGSSIPMTEQGSTSTGSKPVDEKVIASWNQNNAEVVTWILDSVDLSISLSL